MEKLIMLGTGNATVTKCYNTCFAIQKENSYFLVDTGGGNGILTQLEKMQISVSDIHEIFISHEHTDHLLGLIWIIRMVATKMSKDKYDGDLHIYCHKELIDTIMTISKLTIQPKFFDMIGQRIFFDEVSDSDTRHIFGYDITFFDICSGKAKQFGFTTVLDNGKKFTFIGDEPYRQCEYKYAKDSDWLMHEAFCLYRDRDIYSPYDKFHTTVKEACEYAGELNAKNLILFHTEDDHLDCRKALYTSEGREYFSGNIMVPDDLETIDL